MNAGNRIQNLLPRVNFTHRGRFKTICYAHLSAGTILVLLLSVFVLCCQDKPQKPNFIIIFTDDQGYGDAGCYGAKDILTPNLDKMANEGIRFTDFYVPATVCTPSRAALLTGCYPKRVGLHEVVLFPHSQHGLNPSEQILPELLKQYGYQSACIGKWHLGHQAEFMPNNQGFDYFFGVPYSNDMDNYLYRDPPFQSPPLPLYENKNLIESGPDQSLLTQRYTKAAISFIKKNKDVNFFLYLAHNMPHLPLHVSDEFRGSSNRGIYGDVIQEIDWSVGEILNALKEANIDRKTLVFFSSDNGPVLRDDAGTAGPLRGGKATTWEGGQRVPFIAYGPGYFPGNEICRELVTTMDLLPTFVNMAGGSLTDSIKRDGYDISALLYKPDTEKSHYESFVYYSREGFPEAIREGKWKLHIKKSLGWNKDNGSFPVSLFNLEGDIGERQNLASQFPDITDRLSRKIDEFDRNISNEIRSPAQAE